MWIHLKHENVMELCGIDTVWFSGTPCMVMPWAEETNINNYMKKYPNLVDIDHLKLWV